MKSSFSNDGQSNALFSQSKKRLKYGFYFILAITLIVLGRFDHPWIKKVHTGIGVVVTPVVLAFDTVGDAASDAISWVQGLAALEAENNRLREENARLRKFEFAADRGGREILRLQELLKMRPTFVPTLVTARVIAVTGGPYTRSVLIHAGSEDGVREGLPVVDEQGLVGQTIRVGFRATRVLLTTDANSRIPIQIERNNQNGIVVGSNGNLLTVMFTGPEFEVSNGDRIITSGHGGTFPADVLVGTVVAAGEGNVLVLPAANLEDLDFVRVLDYNALQLEPGEGGEE